MPHDEPSDSLPRILSAYDSEGRELLILAQWKSALVVRVLQGEKLFRLTYKGIGVKVLPQREIRSIAIVSDNAALCVFADGRLLKTVPGTITSYLSSRQPRAWLTLGNSPTGESPWRGEILALSLSPQAPAKKGPGVPENRAILQYRFAERSGTICRDGGDPRYDLSIPTVFRAPKKGILTPPWEVQRFDRSFWKDVVVNVLGFIPFGFVVYAWLRSNDKPTPRSAVVVAVVLGGAISLAIELLQAYLPTRDSSLTDVLTNILGTWIGALMFRTVRRILYR